MKDGLDGVTELASTIDALARRIEDALGRSTPRRTRPNLRCAIRQAKEVRLAS